MTLVDTNIILRWLLVDDAQYAPLAEQLVNDAGEGELVITDVILAEVFYVMRGKAYSRGQIVNAINALVAQPAFRFEASIAVIKRLAAVISSTNLDFADCYLLARAVQAKQPLHSFDAALNKTYQSLI
ncbi:MAG: PIN domain-containing protein [Candidatus Saccharimonadales bacterium]